MIFPKVISIKRKNLTAVILIIISNLLFMIPVQAKTIVEEAICAETNSEEDDLTSIRINLEDLTEEFIEIPGYQLSRMETMMGGLLTGLEKASLINMTGYSTSDPANAQILISAIIAPLTPQEIIIVDQQIKNPDAIGALVNNIGGSESLNLDFKGFHDLGNTRFGFSTHVSPFHLDYVVVRRSYILIEVAYLYPEDSEPLRNVLYEAKRLDEKAIPIVGRGDQVGFRPADLLVPELTTFVPTPLDISTEPGVLGANLLFAALIVIGFTIGVELLTRSLNEHEGYFEDRIKPLNRLHQFQKELSRHFIVRRGHSRLLDVGKMFVVVFFYGLVFSLLDRNWNPFSLSGVVLFVNMTVAYGIVGLLDDIVQWMRLRKWEVSAGFSVRPANIFLSSFSTLTSRLFKFVPGLMFGTPKALTVNMDLLDDAQQLTLNRISTITILGTGVALWLVTTVTSILLRIPLPNVPRYLIGGMEGFFLIVFAVAVENTFIQMLGFSGSMGESFKRKNRWLWLCGIMMVTFLFYHTLINPRSELAEAFRTGNVQISLIAMVVFLVFAFLVWEYFKYIDRPVRLEEIPIEQSADSQPLITPANPPLLADFFIGEPPVRTQHEGEKTDEVPQIAELIYVKPGESKTCPVCMTPIKAEARICRFCRVLFEVTLRGYCLQDHAVEEANPQGKCKRCSHDLEDVHIESRLLFDSNVQALKASFLQLDQNITQSDVKDCPFCGRSIKVKAILCRYCQNQLRNGSV